MSEQCQTQVYTDRWGSSKCQRKGVVFEDNQWRCKQHSKAAEEARRAKSEARWNAQRARHTEARQERAEQARRAECYPDLLAALRAAASGFHTIAEEMAVTDPADADLVGYAHGYEAAVRAAVEKAEGVRT